MFYENYGEATDSLKNTFEFYTFNMGKFGVKNIEVTKFNQYYFNKGSNVLDSSYLIFEDYKQFCLFKNKELGVINFLKDSVKNNHDLCDYIEKCKFQIVENYVLIEKSKAMKKNNKYEILGELYFDNYRFTMALGSYYFIESIVDNNEKYMYYGD